MLDRDDLDVVIYPVQLNPPPYMGDWDASFGERCLYCNQKLQALGQPCYCLQVASHMLLRLLLVNSRHQDLFL